MRKLNIYFRVTIAAVEPIEKDKNFLNIFKDTMTVVTEVVDSRTIILPIPGVSENHTQAILDVQHLAISRHLSWYTDNLWIKGNQPTTFKLLLGHNEPTINFSSDQLVAKLVELGSQLKVCNIKSTKISYIGWFIGSSPKQDTQLYTTLFN